MATLKLGDRGPLVTAWQETLNKAGYIVTPDGTFGPETEKQTRAYQAQMSVVADGVVGPATLAAVSARDQMAPIFAAQSLGAPSSAFMLKAGLILGGAALAYWYFYGRKGARK